MQNGEFDYVKRAYEYVCAIKECICCSAIKAGYSIQELVLCQQTFGTQIRTWIALKRDLDGLPTGAAKEDLPDSYTQAPPRKNTVPYQWQRPEIGRRLEQGDVQLVQKGTKPTMHIFDLDAILKNVSHPTRDFQTGYMGDGFFVQIVFNTECAKTKVMKTWTGRKWYVSKHATTSEVVQTCLKAVLTSMEHETRETFKYKDTAIFAPHFDVDKLVKLASDDGNLDVRP